MHGQGRGSSGIRPRDRLGDRLPRPHARLHGARVGAARHDVPSPDVVSGQGHARVVPPGARGGKRIRRPSLGDGRTYTFTVRKGFRFSDGRPVRASAFRASHRSRALDPRTGSPWGRPAGRPSSAPRMSVRVKSAHGLRRHRARGHAYHSLRSTSRLRRVAHRDAVHVRRPADAPGRPGGPGGDARGGAVLRGRVPPRRTHRDTTQSVLRGEPAAPRLRPLRRRPPCCFATRHGSEDRQERGRLGAPGRAVVLRPVDRETCSGGSMGSNRERFFSKLGFTVRLLVFNASRPLLPGQPRVRDARSTSRSTALPGSGGPIATRTHQYLPYAMPGFSDADIYPLAGSDLGRAKELARGNTRGGKVVMYTTDFPPPIATAMAVRQELAEIGLDVEVKAIPEHIASAAYAGQLARPGGAMGHDRGLGAADPRPVRVPERAPRHRVHRRHEPRRIRVGRDRREPSPGRWSASGTGASTNVRRDGRWPRQN